LRQKRRHVQIERGTRKSGPSRRGAQKKKEGGGARASDPCSMITLAVATETKKGRERKDEHSSVNLYQRSLTQEVEKRGMEAQVTGFSKSNWLAGEKRLGTTVGTGTSWKGGDEWQKRWAECQGGGSERASTLSGHGTDHKHVKIRKSISSTTQDERKGAQVGASGGSGEGGGDNRAEGNFGHNSTAGRRKGGGG